MKRNYQPKKRQRKRVHGFRKRMATAGGRKGIAMRRLKGRKKLTAQVVITTYYFTSTEGFLMLHKDRRINQGWQYRFIYRNSRRVTGKYLILFVNSNQIQGNRFGIVTSKRIGNAVVRNRAKRLIREVIRSNLTGLPQGYDLVIVARHNINEAAYEQIEREFLRLIRKAVSK